MKSLFQKLQDQLKSKASTASNSLPPHIVKYGMDYFSAAELMDRLSLEMQKNHDLAQELEKTKLQNKIYKEHLLIAIHALETIKVVGLDSPESKYAGKCLTIIKKPGKMLGHSSG